MATASKTTIGMDDALKAMSQGVALVTANRRLAMEIRGEYDRWQAGKGISVWEGANTVSWGDWMQSLFQECLDLGATALTLLSPQQTRMLWEQVIRQEDRDQEILNPSGAARMADEAWGLLQAWDIPTAQLARFANSETELFLSWVNSFIRRCKREGWIDASLLPGLVVEQLRAATLSVPDRIILAGFDEITPRQQAVLDTLAEPGCEIAFLIPERSPHTARLLQAIDSTQEIHTAARWAIGRLQEQHEARIGIVVPQLAQLRREVEREFDRCLDPVSILPGNSGSEKLYNISLGVALAQCPLVVDAFLILHLATGRLSSSDMGRLLRSPFLAGGVEEKGRRARLDAFIRRSLGECEISLDTLIRKVHEVNSKEDNACPILFNTLDMFRKRLDQLPSRQSPQRWIEAFQGLFNIFGWCKSEGASSIEYQQIAGFNKALVSFQQLGQIQPAMQLQEAIGRLHTLVMETPFQAKGSLAQIQILGILEAAGLRFDHLWITGLSDDAWPQQAAPNPLLPMALQRDLGIPHASPQRELAYARTITERLLTTAPEVIVSHAESDGVRQKRVSSLLADIPQISMNDLRLARVPDMYKAGFITTGLPEVMDNTGPSLSSGSHVSGGSKLLSDQSACPFRAFANHRLGTRQIEEPVYGADGRIRGNITHQILQQVWEKIERQNRLSGMEKSELRRLITAEVGRVLSGIEVRRPHTFVPRFVAIEQRRLTDLILRWLELERLRAPFKVVSLEHKQTVTIGGLQLDVITDRVDELDDGRQLIIDYKSKKKKDLPYKGWFDERIEEPQLPIYAITNQADTAGVVLAAVNAADMGCKGVCEESELVPGIKAFAETKEAGGYAGWDGLKTEWKRQLEMLAAEVMAGRADVSPKVREDDCKYCRLHALCRINEQDMLDHWGDEE